MATQFRQLGPDDADMLAGQLHAWYGMDGVTLDAASLHREIHRLLQDNLSWHAWLIESQGEVAGYLMLQFRKGAALEAPRAYIAALYVVPSMRHRGIGALAHRFVAELGRWLQVRVYEFDTARENKHAHHFGRAASLSPRRHETSAMQATA
ncbi:MAG: GNAT family N-acetyltransferase [Gemmatimonadota bacterium]